MTSWRAKNKCEVSDILGGKGRKLGNIILLYLKTSVPQMFKISDELQGPLTKKNMVGP